MKNSDYVARLYGKMRKLTPLEVDRLLLLYSSEKVKTQIPSDILLAQFKYCLEYGIKDESFYELKKVLALMYSDEIVKELEGLYNAYNKGQRTRSF